MTTSGSRAGWWIVIPALLLGGWVVGSSLLAGRGQLRIGSFIGGQRMRAAAGERANAGGKGLSPAIVERLDNPRLARLRHRG